MRYLLSARVRPGRRGDLLRAIEDGTFGAGFPYGDLGELLASGRVDETGTVRWVEVCYCREYLGVAMVEELPYFEEFLTDIEVSDARSPKSCEGYPACNDCPCTDKVRFDGEPLPDYLRRTAGPGDEPPPEGRPTRWLGWRGRVSPGEAERMASPAGPGLGGRFSARHASGGER
jgi:hypothetical protein